MTKDQRGSNNLALNLAIGSLSIVLLILLFALATRYIYPRIENQRTNAPSRLISDVIQVEVLNGCGVPGLADKFTTKLRKYGFDVVETGNFKNFDVNQSIVIARSQHRKNAHRVADALGIPDKNILIEQSPDFYLDATLVLGSDYKSLNPN